MRTVLARPRWAAALAIILVAGSAFAQGGAPSGAGVRTFAMDPPMAGVVMPEELAGPSEDDIYAAWPAQVRELGIEGMARISCVVTTTGSLQDCKIKSEEYPSLRLGAAALTLVPKFQFKPGSRNGQPAPIALDFTFVFQCGSHCKPLDLSQVRFPMIVIVPWGEAPTPDDIAKAYPIGAKADRIGGRVVLECEFRKDGHLRSCDKTSEEPEGQGFRAAAMALVPKFKAAFPPDADIDSTTVFVPIIFDAGAGRDPGMAIGTPDWTHVPPNSALLQAYPEVAAQQGITQGQASLDCTLLLTGKLGDCSVTAETPAGAGFGRAALSLSDQFAMSLWSPSGLPTAGAHIRAPVSFRLQERVVSAQRITSVETPDWAEKPSGTQVYAAYPGKALRLEKSGRVDLSCLVQSDGHVNQCTVIKEDPMGYSFGAAALSMASDFKMKPMRVDGEAVMPEGARVHIPIIFSAP